MSSTHLIPILLTAAVLLSAAPATAQAPQAATPVLVELFTSQGCSSCPPADALLGELATRSNVVALAYHVDYWDSLGWHDRFEIPAATRRQSAYVSALSLSSAFTPQVIVNGQISLVGSDAARIGLAIHQAARTLQINLRIDGGELVVELPNAGAAKADDVNLAAYLSHASTPVGRGENSGRTLEEFNVVRDFKRLGDWDGGQKAFRIPLASLSRDADRVAVFVQRKDQGLVEATGFLGLR